MKTKKLIELLQEQDPSGELEVCVDNEDILSVHRMQAYWDGRLQVLERDWSKSCYDIVGAKYTSKGDKVKISPLSLEEALLYYDDMPVVVEDVFIDKKMQATVDRWRREAKEINKKLKEEYGEALDEKYGKGNDEDQKD